MSAPTDTPFEPRDESFYELAGPIWNELPVELRTEKEYVTATCVCTLVITQMADIFHKIPAPIDELIEAQSTCLIQLMKYAGIEPDRIGWWREQLIPTLVNAKMDSVLRNKQEARNER